MTTGIFGPCSNDTNARLYVQMLIFKCEGLGLSETAFSFGVPSCPLAQNTWNNGGITLYDNVSVLTQQKAIKFTTMIIARDYMNSGKDLVVGTYRWGWDDFGMTILHEEKPSLKGNSPTQRELDIINFYYPDYTIINK